MSKKTLEIFVGNVSIGKKQPVRIQSMTNTPTKDVNATTEQIIKIWKAGTDFVRVTVPNIGDLEAVKKIKAELKRQDLDIPLVADIHFLPKLAIKSAKVFDKVRINPGNFAELNSSDLEKDTEIQYQTIKEKLEELVAVAKKNYTSIRVGVNHGSLSERMLQRYGDTPEGMVESAIEYLNIFKTLSFDQLIVSLKASNPMVMIYANRLLKTSFLLNRMNYPLHLGVTEAGDGEAGRIKSAIGIGTLLVEGTGETIRVSLTEPPENEIPVAKKIIEYAREVRKGITNPEKLMKPTKFDGRKVNGNLRDFDFNKKPEVILNIPSNKIETKIPDVVVFRNDKLIVNNKEYPLFNIENINKINGKGDKFLLLSLSDLKTHFKTLKDIKGLILIQEIKSVAVPEEIDRFISLLDENQMDNPVIIYKKYREDDLESLQVKAAIDFGRPFINGYGNGVFIDNEGKIKTSEIKDIAFSILQATGALITKTEYIACPSCGRTLFDLETTTIKIRSKTSHLKGLKIAVMGCIVNGIGEMADADYGYVGGGFRKITLYRNKEIIKKGIPEENAVDELIKLIKENNDWVEPK